MHFAAGDNVTLTLTFWPFDMLHVVDGGMLADSRGDKPDNVAGDGTDRLAKRRHQISTQWTISGRAGERQSSHVTTGSVVLLLPLQRGSWFVCLFAILPIMAVLQIIGIGRLVGWCRPIVVYQLVVMLNEVRIFEASVFNVELDSNFTNSKLDTR